jgi:hypothetical protein
MGGCYEDDGRVKYLKFNGGELPHLIFGAFDMIGIINKGQLHKPKKIPSGPGNILKNTFHNDKVEARYDFGPTRFFSS